MSRSKISPRVAAAWHVLRGKPTIYGLVHGEVYLSDAATAANWGLLIEASDYVVLYVASGTTFQLDGGPVQRVEGRPQWSD